MRFTGLSLVVVAIIFMAILAVKAGKCLSDYSVESAKAQQILLDANI